MRVLRPKLDNCEGGNIAKLTAEMKEFVKGKMAYVATISPEGLPSIGPKGSFRVIDDEHIGWNESTGKHTFENLQKNPNVAVAIADRETRQGYRFTGKAQLLREGSLYESTAEGGGSTRNIDDRDLTSSS